MNLVQSVIPFVDLDANVIPDVWLIEDEGSDGDGVDLIWKGPRNLRYLEFDSAFRDSH